MARTETPAGRTAATDDFDALVRSASDGARRAQLRLGVTVIVSAFLFIYVGVLAGAVWLAVAVAIEGAGVVIRSRVRAGDRRAAFFYVASLFAISVTWMAHAVLLWRTGGLIPQIAAIMDVFSLALYAALGAHKDRRLLLALLAPPLVTLCAMLIPMAWAQGQPAGALVATFATFGACGTLVANALAMYRSDRELSAAVRALAQERADLERRVAERTADLAEAVERASAASAAKTRFLAALSHELRTPLNAVIGYAELIADDLTLTKTASPEDAVRISVHGRRLLTLINEAIDFAELDEGDIVGRRESFTLDAVVDDARRACTPIARAVGAEVDLRVVGDAGAVLGDRARIGRCLAALAVNASRAAGHDARIGIETAIESNGTGAWLRMQVEDLPAGAAVSDDLGAGIGFGVVRRLVDLMGGDVVIESATPDAAPSGAARIIIRAPVELAAA
ncbi:MAG: hypothetical protein KJS97_07480 [Alphaproteobacteria bacterium]|nr:hypothetical protein [Alphaproteobacteria bacterium]